MTTTRVTGSSTEASDFRRFRPDFRAKVTRACLGAVAGSVLAIAAGACGGSGGGSIGSSMAVKGPSGHPIAAVTLTEIVDPAQPAPGSGAVLLQDQPGQKIVDLVFSVKALGSLTYTDTPRITLPAGSASAYTTNGGNLSTDFTDSSSADGFEVLPHRATLICVSFVVPVAFHPSTVQWVPNFGRGTPTLTWSASHAG